MEDILAILIIGGGAALFLLGFSPIGRAVADRIRGKHALLDLEEVRAELAQARETHGAELEQVRQEVAELAERLDFAERLLAKQREVPRIGQGG